MKRSAKIISATLIVCMFVQLLPMMSFAAETSFRDVVSDKYYDAAKVTYDLGFMPDVYDKPAGTVTKEDMAYVLIKLLGLENTAQESINRTSFADLKKGTYLNGCAYVLKNKSIMAGSATGTFDAADAVTYIQAIKVLVDSIGYKEYAMQKGGYPTGYLATAYSIGISSGLTHGQNDTFTVEELAQFAFNTLESKIMERVYTANGYMYNISDESLLYRLGYVKYKGDFSPNGVDINVTGTRYNSDAPNGAEVEEAVLTLSDEDIYSYPDSARILYVYDNCVLSALPHYTASVSINDGSGFTDWERITIKLNETCYTKYSIDDGELYDIPANKSVVYLLKGECGDKTVKVTLAGARGKTVTITKNIKFKTSHYVRYYLNGSLYAEQEAYCGEAVPEVETPAAPNCEFSGWDGSASVMPHGDLDINGSLRYLVKLNGFASPATGRIFLPNLETIVPENVIFSLIYNSSNYDDVGDLRKAPQIVYIDQSGKRFTYTYERSPLLLTKYGGWYDGVYTENEVSLEFNVPHDLKEGLYTVRVELTIPGGKESNSEVKPIVFEFDNCRIFEKNPGGSAGGGGPDRSVISDPFYDAAKVVYDLGFMENIYSNYADNVTREDLCYALVKFAGLEEEVEKLRDTQMFTDLEVGSYLNGCAVLLFQKNLIPVPNDGAFRPELKLYLVDALKPFVDYMGYAPYVADKGGYPQGYMAAASNIGMTRNINGKYDAPVTNEQFAEVVYRALNGKLMRPSPDGKSYTWSRYTPITYFHGYSVYQGKFSLDGENVNLEGTVLDLNLPEGTDVSTTLLCKDSDVADYVDNGLEAYVKDGEILSSVPYYKGEVIANHNNWDTKVTQIPINVNTIGYTKYSINDGEYALIPEDGVIIHTLEDVCQNNLIIVRLASTNEKHVGNFTKYVTLRVPHKITYIADGEIYREDYYYCEQAIIAPAGPQKEGYTFDKWDNLPLTMTHGDITVNAVFTKDAEPEPENPVVFTVQDTTDLETVKGAVISISGGDLQSDLRVTSNENGVAKAHLENGKYSVQVLANGFEPRNFAIEITDENKSFNIYLNKNPLVDIKTNVSEMTKQEMEDAGIDMDSAENKHIYKCTTVLKFVPAGEEGSTEITPVEINFDYFCDDKGSIIKANPVHTGGKIIYPVARDIYLIVHSEVTWYKEMFDVELIATNTSVIETMTDMEAVLELPEGLSLADMAGEEQSLAVAMGDILPGGVGSVHWYVRGDKEGEYNLSGNVTGIRTGGGITESAEARFVTPEPITVLGGSAMHLLIKAEKYAKPGLPYRMEYTLTNKSAKTLYDVVLNVLGGKFCKAYSIQEIIHNGELLDMNNLGGSFNGGKELKAEEFKSGDTLSGVFEIIFGQGIDTEENTLYMVKEMYNFIGAGSTTVIPTDIILVDKVEVHEHNWNSGVIVKPSTKISDGLKKYTCTLCGEIKYETLAAGTEKGSKGVRAYITKTPVNQNGDLITSENIGDTKYISFEVDNFSGEDIEGRFVVIFFSGNSYRVGLASCEQTLAMGTTTVTVPVDGVPGESTVMKIMLWDSKTPLKPLGVAEDFVIN